MTKLCPRGKAAAKRKFKVYPSAYANAYASKICAGKIKDPSGLKRKDFRGPKPSKASGGRVGLKDGSGNTPMTPKQKKFAALAPAPPNAIFISLGSILVAIFGSSGTNLLPRLTGNSASPWLSSGP